MDAVPPQKTDYTAYTACIAFIVYTAYSGIYKLVYLIAEGSRLILYLCSWAFPVQDYQFFFSSIFTAWSVDPKNQDENSIFFANPTI